MDNIKLENTNDPIDILKQAKPEETSDSRIEHLIQKSESKTSIRYRSPIGAKAKFALLTSPALIALLVVQGLNQYSSSPTLSLDLRGSMSPSLSSPLSSSSADCVIQNQRCNGGWIDWNYTFLPSVSSDSPDGPVYSLSRFGKEKELVQALAQKLGIDQPISKEFEEAGEDSQTLYSAGSREDEIVYVGYSRTSTNLSYINQAGKDWIRCQSDSYRYTEDCSSVTFENMPSESKAASYAQELLKTIDLTSSEDVSNLKDGDYFIQVAKTESETIENHQQNMLTVSARMILNGEPTAGGVQFYWFKGSSKLFMIDGVIYKAEAKGVFRTLNAENSLVRLNKYVTLPSVREQFTPSQKSIEGMPWEQRKKFYDVALGKADPLSIDVTITRADQGLVTIYDAKGNAWVVPGIHYFDETGYLGSATSLNSEFIQMDKPKE